MLGVEERSADGMTTGQQLTAIEDEADRLVDSQEKVWVELQAELAEAGIVVRRRRSRSTRKPRTGSTSISASRSSRC